MTSSKVKNHPMPFCRAEVVVMSIIDGRLNVLLARRAEPPFEGELGLVGGVVRIDKDQSLDEAAKRVMHERTSLDLGSMRQLCAVGGPTRDPRAPWALSVVYRALAVAQDLKLTPGKRTQDLVWRDANEAKNDETLAFDHAQLIAKAVEMTQFEVDHSILPVGFLPGKFTLGELQIICEQILGRRLNKANFRRKMADRNQLTELSGEMKTGAFRPAQLYCVSSYR